MYSTRWLLPFVVVILPRHGAPEPTTRYGMVADKDAGIQGATSDPGRVHIGLLGHWRIQRPPPPNITNGLSRNKRRSRRCAKPPCRRTTLYAPPGVSAPQVKGCSRPPCKRTTLYAPADIGQGGDCYICQFESDCGVRFRATEGLNIRGGKTVRAGEWTWTVAILEVGAIHPFCGGSLITDRHVLTAAHCLVGKDFTRLRVRAGHIDLDTANPVDDIKVAEMIPHPSYHEVSWDSDIGILILHKQLPMNSQISVVCLPDEREHEGRLGIAIGWGTTDDSGTIPAERLLQVNLSVMTNEECASKHAGISRRPITENMVCAGRTDKDGYDACEGDSGGPLVVENMITNRWYLEGIISWGPRPCGNRTRPGVYARVSRFNNWIVGHIG